MIRTMAIQSTPLARYAPVKSSDLRLIDNRGRIARLLWWLLGWFDPQFDRSVRETVQQLTTIDEESLLGKIMFNRHQMQQLFHREAKFLVLGRSEVQRLIGEQESRHYFEFPLTGRLGMDGGMRCCGLTVVCVPWLEGWTLLPELKEFAR